MKGPGADPSFGVLGLDAVARSITVTFVLPSRHGEPQRPRVFSRSRVASFNCIRLNVSLTRITIESYRNYYSLVFGSGRSDMKHFPTDRELVVMGILQNQPTGLYGLQIVERSEGLIKRGSVYVLLGRLEEKGFVEATRPQVAQNHSGMARPCYKLTAEGVRMIDFVGAPQLVGDLA